MIRSFKNRDTRRFFEGHRVTAYHGSSSQAVRRLTLLDSAEALVDLATWPSNRLARYFGTTPQLWLNLQKTWELRRAEIQTGNQTTEQVTPRLSAA